MVKSEVVSLDMCKHYCKEYLRITLLNVASGNKQFFSFSLNSKYYRKIVVEFSEALLTVTFIVYTIEKFTHAYKNCAQLSYTRPPFSERHEIYTDMNAWACDDPEGCAMENLIYYGEIKS